ncbi:hypothetical protein KS4_18320 [Poriferisphaera corsica]|uniref:Uncharacterized protein n=1 Tax=Poriferisphaera corsica TaxID=2528020 RepID=A0A517YU61_9BACT|nr:hypothetical protein [Poriferisphaera corsica]QDU33775.1 hypothetical protein KS4_18320 [Poriferisphaera corsica]
MQSTVKQPISRQDLKNDIVVSVAREMRLRPHLFALSNANIQLLAKGRQAIAIIMRRRITGITQTEIGECLGGYKQRRVSKWIEDGKDNPEVMEIVENAANFKNADFGTGM